MSIKVHLESSFHLVGGIAGQIPNPLCTHALQFQVYLVNPQPNLLEVQMMSIYCGGALFIHFIMCWEVFEIEIPWLVHMIMLIQIIHAFDNLLLMAYSNNLYDQKSINFQDDPKNCV